MKGCLLKTDASLAATIARLTVAIVFIPHGLQMTLGFFGGYGFSATMEVFTTQLGIPTVVAFLVIMAESVGAFALALGFMTRFCALSLIIVMLGAIFMSHLPNGFFMNWFNNPELKEGYEYHLLVIGLCLSLVVSGGGCCSVDRMLAGGKAGCCGK